MTTNNIKSEALAKLIWSSRVWSSMHRTCMGMDQDLCEYLWLQFWGLSGISECMKKWVFDSLPSLGISFHWFVLFTFDLIDFNFILLYFTLFYFTVFSLKTCSFLRSYRNEVDLDVVRVGRKLMIRGRENHFQHIVYEKITYFINNERENGVLNASLTWYYGKLLRF